MELRELSEIEELDKLSWGSDILLVEKINVSKGKFQGVDRGNRESSDKLNMKEAFGISIPGNEQNPEKLLEDLNKAKRTEMYSDSRTPAIRFENYGRDMRFDLNEVLGENYKLYVVENK